MRILIAEDDKTTRIILEKMLTKWNYDVVSTSDGISALKVLNSGNAPKMAILDYMMPGLNGFEVCKKVRQVKTANPPHIIFLTSLQGKEAIVIGLELGANDYICKPFDNKELQARINVGKKVLGMQTALNKRINELNQSLKHIKTLQGILPFCLQCHKIRIDDEAKGKVHSYLKEYTDAELCKSICPDCLKK